MADQARFATVSTVQFPDPLELTADRASPLEVPPLFVDGLGRAHYTTQLPPQPVPPAFREFGDPDDARRRYGWPADRAREWIIATDRSGTHVAHQHRDGQFADWTLVDWLLSAADRWGVLDVHDPDVWPAEVLERIDDGTGWSG